MAIFLGRRRQVGIRLESTTGTPNAPVLSSSIDNTPLLRDAKIALEPISVERPTLRLTNTPIGDIYPGKSLATLTVTTELCTHSVHLSGGAVIGGRPNATRWLQACGFFSYNETHNVFGYKLNPTPTVDNGPLRHGEIVTGTGVTAPNGWTVVGDTYADDGTLYVQEPTGGPLSGPTFTGATSTSAFAVTTKGVKVFAWAPTSDINTQITNGASNATISLYDDGKLFILKGCAGNVEFGMTHGDAVLATYTMRGVVVSYTDTAMPTNGLDQHKYPPTFLGARVTLRHATNTPSTAQKYGTGGASGGGITGALNSLRLRSGNNVVLHENSIDPNGVNYAIITGRKPEGNFNPDEVLETEFSFMTNFFLGKPLRLRVACVGPVSTSVAYDDPSTFNQNAWEWICPGVVMSAMGDADRDGLNAWDGAFKVTGGDYDTSAQGEAPGNDSEFVILNR